MHYYQHHIGDFIRDTARLNNDQSMAYLRLLWMYYDTEEPLSNDVELLSFQIGASQHDVSLILRCYFTKIGDYWMHSRCDKEITTYHQRIDQRSEAGKKSAAKRKNLTSVDNSLDTSLTSVQRSFNENTTDVQLTNNHKPITNNQEPINKNIVTKVAAPDGVSVELWSDFLTLRRSKKLPVTKTALDGLTREATKAGMSIAQVIRTCCERGWGGFKAEWLKDSKQQLTGQQSAWLTITGQTLNNEDDYHGRTIEADFLPPALLGK